jgi:putative ABC transport system permease protein
MLRRTFARVRKTFVEGRAVIGTALRGMIANRLRAFLSTLGIAIGVATLMAIYALVQGLTASFTQQIAQLGSNTLFVSSRPWVMRGDWWKYRNRPPVTQKDVDALRAGAPLLTAVAPVGFAMADVKYMGQTMELVAIRGTTSEYIDTASIKVAAGRFLSPVDTDLDEQVAVIGSEVADRLLAGIDPVGTRILVGAQRFTVIGVLKAQGKAFGNSLDNLVIMPLGAFGRMFGTRRDLSIAVTAPNEHLNEAEEQVIEVLRRSRGLEADQADTFSINRQSELVKIFRQETNALFGVALAIGIITLIVGGIGVMNIMLVAVTERTREIGVRRALGARQRTILAQFLIEASLVTLLGGAIGTAMGIGGAKILSILTPLSASASPQAAVVGLVFSAAVGLAFGTWPAYRAATLDPIESLRYE